jgi:hypothetical protein
MTLDVAVLGDSEALARTVLEAALTFSKGRYINYQPIMGGGGHFLTKEKRCGMETVHSLMVICKRSYKYCLRRSLLRTEHGHGTEFVEPRYLLTYYSSSPEAR